MSKTKGKIKEERENSDHQLLTSSYMIPSTPGACDPPQKVHILTKENNVQKTVGEKKNVPWQGKEVLRSVKTTERIGETLEGIILVP